MQLELTGLPAAFIGPFENTLTGGVDPTNEDLRTLVCDLEFPTMSHACELVDDVADSESIIDVMFLRTGGSL